MIYSVAQLKIQRVAVYRGIMMNIMMSTYWYTVNVILISESVTELQ